VSYQPYSSGTSQASPPLDLPYYGIGLVDAVKRGFKKYATFKGRASRSEYWWWTLFTFLAYLVLGLLTYAVGVATSRDGGRTPGALAIPLIILLMVFFLGILLPTLALTVRRLHDTGYSGLLALLLLLPYLGSLIILISRCCRAHRLVRSTTPYRQVRPFTIPIGGRIPTPLEVPSGSHGTGAGREECPWPRDRPSSMAAAVRPPGWSLRHCAPPCRE
jgi:uncharacterized membrane protein YhaH (DUF805 family)